MKKSEIKKMMESAKNDIEKRIDDNKENVDSAKNIGISTIKVEKDTDIIQEIDLILSQGA